MKRLILRIVVLATVLVLGIIAIAYAQRSVDPQRSSADVQQEADTATREPATDADTSTAPRLLPANEHVNPLRPRQNPSTNVAQADALPTVGPDGKSSRPTIVTVAGSDPSAKPFDPFGPLTKAATPDTQGGNVAAAGRKDISLDPPADTLGHGASLDPPADVRSPLSSAASKDLGPNTRPAAAPVLNRPSRPALDATGGLRRLSLSPATNINLTSGTGSDSARLSATATPGSGAARRVTRPPGNGRGSVCGAAEQDSPDSRAGTV